jgi:hypothetical protein
MWRTRISQIKLKYRFQIPVWGWMHARARIRIVGVGVQAGSTRHVGHWMAYCTCPGWPWWWRIWWNEDWQEKPKYLEKSCPSATLSTTNPTWPDPGSNPGRRSGKPATNRLSYGAAFQGHRYFWALLSYSSQLTPRPHLADQTLAPRDNTNSEDRLGTRDRKQHVLQALHRPVDPMVTLQSLLCGQISNTDFM